MPLPTTIVSSATTTWSDHRNQSHGGAQRVEFRQDVADNGTFYNLGDTVNYVGVVAAYTGQAGHKLVRFRCFLSRVGSPTGNLSVEVRTALGAASMDLAVAPLGVSRLIPVNSIPTTKTEIIFTFPVPVTLPSPDTQIFGIVVTISVQGDSSNYIKVHKGVNGDRGTSHAYGAGTQTWVAETGGSGISLAKVTEISKSGARVVVADKSGNLSRVYKTDDNNGPSWSLEGSAGSLSNSSNLKSLNTQGNIHDLGTTYAIVGSVTTSSTIYKRSEVAGLTADPATPVNFTAVNTNISGAAVYGGGRRFDGTTVIVTQGVTETVMGSARRRIKLAFYNGTSWSAIFDVQGSTNTPNSTLPGDGVDYDLRWAAIDPNGDCHIVYSRSDSSTLQYRKFKSDNTFATINTLNGAVASATANYSVGQGCFSYSGTSWRVHVPYVDNGTNTLKEARCVTTATETSASWTITQIVAANAETTGSNPAVLIADNLQGGKVVCVRVKPTTKGLATTHDSGSGTWVSETDWRGATQTCGGISGFYTEDGIALVYLEESTTPDELRYDRL